MKCIIIGLGNFGAPLAQMLTEMGNEVIGIDNKMSKVDALKEKITHTICLNCTDVQAVSSLPLRDTDLVIIAIGEDEGANLMATAIMKQFKVKRIISRAVSPLHLTILEAIEVDEIIHPEEEAAERLAKRLNIKGVIDSYELTPEYHIIEARTPKRYVGKTLEQIGFRRNYNVVVLTTIKETKERNLLGALKKVNKVQGVASATTVLEENDIMVMYGKIDDIQKVLGEPQ